MKNILSLLLIIGCAILVFSCKSDGAKAGNEESNAKTSTKDVIDPIKTSLDSDSILAMVTNMIKIKPHEVAGMKQDAELIINHRLKETGEKSHIILDKGLWEFEFIFVGRARPGPNQLSGYWVDFSEDLTYTFGQYQDVLGGGRYHYSIDSGLLLMINDSDKIKPQEFEAKIFDVTLIMDGNHIYRDNNYNAKLKRITERPTKMN